MEDDERRDLDANGAVSSAEERPGPRRYLMVAGFPAISGPQAEERTVEISSQEVEILWCGWSDVIRDLLGFWAYRLPPEGYRAVKEYAKARLDHFAAMLGAERVRELELGYKLSVSGRRVVDWQERFAAGCFGTCPMCGNRGELTNIGPSVWAACDAHRLKWPVPREVVPDWDRQDPAEWIEATPRVAQYTEVQPKDAPMRLW